MEVFLVVSYRKFGKKKIPQRSLIRRCKQFRNMQRLALGANVPTNDLHTLVYEPDRKFKGLIGSDYGLLSIDGKSAIISNSGDETGDIKIDLKLQPQAHVPEKFLMSFGVTEATISEVKKFQKHGDKQPIMPREVIIYKDMILLSHETAPRLFIGGEEITFVKLISYPRRRPTNLFGVYQCSTDPQFAISFSYSYKALRSGAQVLDLKRLRSIIQWQMEKIVAKSTKKPGLAAASYLWDCLTGSFDQEAVPEELNPVLHYYPKSGYNVANIEYLPKTKKVIDVTSELVTINRVRRGRPLYENHEHEIVKAEHRIQTHVKNPRCITIEEERYLFILSEQVYNAKFAITCVDLQEKTRGDCYALEFVGQTFSKQDTSVVSRRKSDLTVLKRGSQQTYFHVLVAGFQAGLLLFTYYEKRFGLSGVFTLPDGKKSSIPVSLCPSSCGKFCYAYTSSEIYRVVIKPDKLL